MHVASIGGGPAGLYCAILLKRKAPACRIRVIERGRVGDTYGWGVVFSDRTLDTLAQADPISHREITAAFARWDDIAIHVRDQCIRSGGHGFAGIGRGRLLDILQRRAEALGVELEFEREAAATDSDIAAADLIIAADGIHSATRSAHADIFQPEVHRGRNRYLWLAARCPLDAFTFAVKPTPAGWFTLHAYRYDQERSTFIVEAPETVWRTAGLDTASPAASVDFCQALFGEHLNGARLESLPGHARGSEWLNFNRLVCKRWHHGKIVLLGDAAHTAHFSVGSGTKLALEDGIALANALDAAIHGSESIDTALARYQAEREPAVLRLQSAARNRQEWFENVARYVDLPPWQFAYSLLTGSQRLGHATLKERDAAYVAKVEAELRRAAGIANDAPPMFTPFRVAGLSLHNRVVVSPMATYSAVDGLPNDFHLTHLTARALGGAGLVMTEMTCVSPDGRITSGCTGLWNEEQQAAWARIVDAVHRHSGARIGMQLGHAGPKGATGIPWEAEDQPLGEAGWPLLAASAEPWSPRHATPKSMTAGDMEAVRNAFTDAARRALAAGFDWLELHCAHGYLLSSFLSPLSNRRTDAYGGTLENRMRYPLDVFIALRTIWPTDKPLSVRISAHDWAPGGNTDDDAVAMARAFKAAGADLIDVSSGQTTPHAAPRYGRMYQTPFADRIRNEVNIPVMAVGNITEADQINTIVAAGRADLCALGRPHLANPNWTLHAAATQGYCGQPWPNPYLPGAQQWQRAARPEVLP